MLFGGCFYIWKSRWYHVPSAGHFYSVLFQLEIYINMPRGRIYLIFILYKSLNNEIIIPEQLWMGNMLHWMISLSNIFIKRINFSHKAIWDVYPHDSTSEIPIAWKSLLKSKTSTQNKSYCYHNTNMLNITIFRNSWNCNLELIVDNIRIRYDWLYLLWIALRSMWPMVNPISLTRLYANNDKQIYFILLKSAT